MFRNDVVVQQLHWLEAFDHSIQRLSQYTLLTFDVLGKMITGRLSPRALSGPIGIAQISGQAYRTSFLSLLALTAIISLQLGIFNLLPIPVLDGGMILLLLVESLLRKDISLKLRERVTMAGMAFLVFLALFVIYNDIMKVIGPG